MKIVLLKLNPNCVQTYWSLIQFSFMFNLIYISFVNINIFREIKITPK